MRFDWAGIDTVVVVVVVVAISPKTSAKFRFMIELGIFFTEIGR
jgi:hypothetical protein